MDSCESSEIAVEQRRLGALAAAEVARLEEHLATCESCRRFAEFVVHSERAMTSTDATMTDADWAFIKKTLRRGSRIVFQRRLLHIIFAVAAAPLLTLAVGYEPAETLPWLLAWMIPPFAVRIALDRRNVRQMSMLAARDADFFARYRAFVRRQITGVWATIVWLPFAALGLDVYGWVLAGHGTSLTVICRVLLVVVASLLSAWLYLAGLRPLAQIRAQLP